MAFERGWIAVLITLFTVSRGLNWTAGLPDSAVVHACKGGNLTLPWNVTLDSGEAINHVEWFYDGQSRQLVATYTGGNFFTMPTFSHRVQPAENAGIVLSHMTTSDAGNYSVEVVAHEALDAAGKLTTLRHSAVVDVATQPPMTSDVSLHVRQESVAVYDQSTDEWRVGLACGTLTDRGQPPVDVIWTTPAGTTVSSTGYADGEFRLLLPNPVTGGTYTCHLPHDSSAAACLPKDSPILTPAAVDIDEVKARLSLIEVKQQVLLEENKRLEAALKENLTSYVLGVEANLVKKMNEINVTERMIRVENQLDRTKQQIHDMATRHVSFYAHLTSNTLVSSGATIILSTVISNEGGAYNSTTGRFTSPYSGTYVITSTASTSVSAASLYMTVDGSYVSYLYADEDLFNMGSCQAVVHLTAGQRVWLVSNGDSQYFSVSTTFSGFLINAD